MITILQILPEMAVLGAIVGAILYVVVAFRDPFRPQWLRWNWMAVAASLAIAAVFNLALGILMSGGVAAGLGALSAIVLTLAVAGGAFYAFMHGFHISERLWRSDAGQSPFYPLAGGDALMRAWRRQFKGRAGA